MSLSPTGGPPPGGPPAGGPRDPRDRSPSPTTTFSKEWSTERRQSLYAAVQEFFRAWHPERGNMRLKGRRPREVEVRLTLSTGDSIRLYFAGEKTIDGLLSGRQDLLEQQLKRAGVTSEMLASGSSGALAGLQLAVSGLYPVSGEDYGRGVRSSAPTGMRGKIASVREQLAMERAEGTPLSVATVEAELQALLARPQTNREAMERFQATSVYAAEKRLEELGPRGAFEEAVRLAAKSPSAGVEIKVPGVRVPVRPQVAPGDSARVEVVHRQQQDADVPVLRSQATGRFVSALPIDARLRILERAESEGFSAVARETGIARTTIYEWRRLRDES